MEIVFVLLPITLVLALAGVGAYIWSVRSGQFDDLETPALKPLIDGEPSRQGKPENGKKPNQTAKKHP